MSDEKSNKLLKGYTQLAERVHELLAGEQPTAGKEPTGRFKKALAVAKDELLALKDLTQLEVEQLGQWLERDLHAMAESVSETKDELKEWVPIELAAEESYLFDKLMSIADQTTLELLQLKEQAALSEYDIWRTGEITGPGTLECTQCGERLHFSKPGHIPPCPKCKNTTFVRIKDTPKEASKH